MPGIFPRTDDAFSSFIAEFFTELGAHYQDYGFLAQDLPPLTVLKDAWTAAYTAHQAAQVAAEQKTAEKTGARLALEAGVRGAVMKINAVPGLTDAQRIALGLHVPDPTPTPVGPPASRPLAQVSVSGPLQHTVAFRDEAMGAGRGKPAGVRGAQIWCKVGEPPAGTEELRFLAEDTATPYVATFEPADAGKLAYYRLRWVNPRGEAGPWSEVVSGMITP